MIIADITIASELVTVLIGACFSGIGWLISTQIKVLGRLSRIEAKLNLI